MSDQDSGRGRYASPPCMAGDLAPGYFDPLGVDPAQAGDVDRWRRAERARLRARRQAMSVAAHQRASHALAGHLRDFLSSRPGGAKGRVVSGYWPIKGEPDLRPVLAELHDAGVMVALPVVEVRAAPLVFRRWSPATRMVLGDWNIPVPPPDAGTLTPDITLAPVMGWDSAGYRLGYGGGYFDRTLAALSPRPVSIGVGFQSAQLATIYPQPHDIPLDVILTEAGIQFTRGIR
ncbi:5-formyltetrahydrofolate cyclo-ligase [Rhodovulum euryhalinum]|uniref:5-formyltetrahydrofolate cyclo-ligase n=1 Tax=Rhodovulum euryhalinum TaxID=35805 RepID=A0A4R2KGT2_9RHOB|nr:5-formyltetrahydrofolate cyclo-ligase [Rhodovulum euryhalinum]TCO69188.1 5-formyltetrahydrofolate cyclo-ligase [Rhodovulum euryhalinum]